MLNRDKWHDSVTDDRVLEAAERQMRTFDDPGICLACGHEQQGIGPAVRDCKCEVCGALQVCGAEKLLISIS